MEAMSGLNFYSIGSAAAQNQSLLGTQLTGRPCRWHADAFVVVWAFCFAGLTFHFTKDLPVLGYGVRALQNLYLPPETDKAKQQSSMVELIKAR